MTQFYNMSIGFVDSHTTVGEQFQNQSPSEMKDFIYSCLETLGEQGIDVDDALNAVENIEILREFDVAVTLTFDLMIKVTAPDEETAETLVQGFEAEDLVSGITSCYDLDGLDNIDIQSNDIVIDGVEEA